MKKGKNKKKNNDLLWFFVIMVVAIIIVICILFLPKGESEPTYMKYVGIYHSDTGGGKIIGSKINDFYLYEDKTCKATGQNNPGRSIYIYNCRWYLSRDNKAIVIEMTPPSHSNTDTYTEQYAMDIVDGGLLYYNTVFTKIK